MSTHKALEKGSMGKGGGAPDRTRLITEGRAGSQKDRGDATFPFNRT